MKKFFVGIFVVVLSLGVYSLVQNSKQNNNTIIGTASTDLNIETDKEVIINNTTISVEVVDSIQEQNRGLMGREYLKPNTGMLFNMNDNDYHSVWMANTKIPLDVIWISQDKRIVDIKENFLPCQEEVIVMCEIYTPKEKAKYILEINAGETQKGKLKVGDNVNLVI